MPPIAAPAAGPQWRAIHSGMLEVNGYRYLVTHSRPLRSFCVNAYDLRNNGRYTSTIIAEDSPEMSRLPSAVHCVIGAYLDVREAVA